MIADRLVESDGPYALAFENLILVLIVVSVSFAYDPSSARPRGPERQDRLEAVAVEAGADRRNRLQPADRSLLGVRHSSGKAALVRIPFPYKNWEVVHAFPWEHVPTDLNISPDGKLLSATVSTDNGDQFLRVWQLDKIMEGDLKPLSEYRFGQSVPDGFVHRCIEYLRYEVATGAVEAVSNAESGFFRPVPLADGRLVVLTYSGAGFIPTVLEPKPLEDVQRGPE